MRYQNHIVVAVLLLVGGTLAWVRHSQLAAPGDGNVVSLDSGTGGNSAPAMDAGDGKEISLAPESSSNASARALPVAEPSTESSPTRRTTDTDAVAADGRPAGDTNHDTLPPVSADGLAFSGSGKFQWYRQGNITWRLDTQNGASCIAFATMAEWRRPSVYAHGCGRG